MATRVMRELLYNIPSTWIAGFLFVSMGLGIEAGYRVGLADRSDENESSRAHIRAVQASLLGTLALLLGFTFSLALQRFDSRSQAVVEEANAIGTAYLRADLLPAEIRDEAKKWLRDYVDLRVRHGKTALDHQRERQAQASQVDRAQQALWRVARQAAEANASPVTSGLFIQALNDMIDAYGKRQAALDRHVPETVLFLLYGTFLMAGMILGYASGVAGHRASFVSYIMTGLIVVLVFIILDLDRPRRGLIEVSQSSLINLQATMKAAASEAELSTTQ